VLTRRELVVAGGLTFAGRLLPSSLWARQRTASTVDVAMHAAAGGARVWFDPLGLLVRPGTTVRWVLREGVHTTTAYHPANGDRPRRIPEGARPWDSGYLTDPGATFEVTLEVEGVYDFFCRPHEASGMVGRIVVSSEADSRSSSRSLGAAEDRVTSQPEDDHRLPAGARDAFPAVEDILRRQTIRPGEDPS
jgi:plastocyanin